MRRFRSRFLVPAFACFGCGGSEPLACRSEVKPTFVMEVSAALGPLPADTRLEVRHGGGVEEYRLGGPAVSRVLFCSAGPHGGSFEVGLTELRCELWTAGAASVRVEATGYPALERLLAAEVDACGGVQTVTAKLVLALGDGG